MKKVTRFLLYLIFTTTIIASCKSKEEEYKEKEDKEVERLMKKEEEDSTQAANINPNSNFDYDSNYYDEDYHRYLKFGTLIKFEGAGIKYSDGSYQYYFYYVKRINGSIAKRITLNNLSQLVGTQIQIFPKTNKQKEEN